MLTKDYFKKGDVYINNECFMVVLNGELSFDKIVELSECGVHPADCTVKYTNGMFDWKTLHPGESAHLSSNNMRFEVTYTGPML